MNEFLNIFCENYFYSMYFECRESIFSINYWKNGIPSYVIATVFGASTSSIIGGFVQYAFSRNKSVREKIQSDKSKALAIFTKYIGILNHISDFRIMFNEMRENARNNAPRLTRNFEIIQPIVGSHFEIDKIDFVELELLFEMNEREMINRIQRSQSRVASCLYAIKSYCEKRISLTDSLPAYLDGPVRVSTLSHEQMLIFGPKMAELDDLANQFLNSIAEIEPEGRVLIKDLSIIFKRRFGEKIFPSVTFGD